MVFQFSYIWNVETFKPGDTVICIETEEVHIIEDIEITDDSTLLYTEDYQCFPSNLVKRKMTFNRGDKVVILDTIQVKTISDSEIVSDVEIYHMTDNTTYSLNDIVLIESIVSGNDLFSKIGCNKDRLTTLNDWKTADDHWSDNSFKK